MSRSPLVAAVLTAVVLSSPVSAQEPSSQAPSFPSELSKKEAPACDCTAFPWKPQGCVKKCSDRVALKSPKQIESITGLPAADVAELKKAEKAEKKGDGAYEEFFKTDSGKRYMKALEGLSETQLETLVKPGPTKLVVAQKAKESS